jgi:hypothetical protein
MVGETVFVAGKTKQNHRAGGPAFQSRTPSIKVGAPLFAHFAKGGHDAACSAGFDFQKISSDKQHRTRPCIKRKDGAPAFTFVATISKAGPPAP